MKYPDATPVDEPVVKPKPAPKPKPKPMPDKSIYPDSVPVDEPVRMAKGGSASSRADGIAQRGKTRGKMC
jgi:hypothetical protein